MTPSEQTPQTIRSLRAEPRERARARGHSRRAFLFKLSLLLNGAVGAVLAVPIIGYLLGPAMKKSSKVITRGSRLGRSVIFPKAKRASSNYPQSGHDRLGRPDRRHSLLGPSRLRQHIPGLRHQLRTPWLSGPLVRSVQSSFCAPATAAPTTQTDRAPPARRSAASSSTTTRLLADSLMISAGRDADARQPGESRSSADADRGSWILRSGWPRMEQPKPRCESCQG